MKTEKMILTIAIALVLTAVSCKEKPLPDTSDSVKASDTSVVTDTSVDNDPVPIEKCDYKGVEFRILYPNWFLYNDYFFADEVTGDSMNDAIYERTSKTEEHLGIEIKTICHGYIETIFPSVQKSVSAGDDEYDLVLTHCIDGVSQLASENYVINMRTLPGVSFNEKYWNEKINSSLAINDKRLFVASDFTLPDPNAILFNKHLIDDYDLENPYELVTIGAWTWDKLDEMSRNVSSDLNGDGIYDENDLYGFVAQVEWKMNSIPQSCGLFIVENKDGSYQLGLNNEKMYSVVEKMNKLFNSSDSTFTWVSDTDHNEMRTGIIYDRALFELATLNESAIYRKSAVDFGILPFPKYDEKQSDYISLDWRGLMCVPVTVSRPEIVGNTLEMLSYFSHDTTQIEYRNTLLGDKMARDNESVDMLDIIFDGCVCDFGLNYLGFNNLTYTIPNLCGKQNSADFASYYQKNAPQVKKMLDELMEKLG